MLSREIQVLFGREKAGRQIETGPRHRQSGFEL
jgi:hypothetical protein